MYRHSGGVSKAGLRWISDAVPTRENFPPSNVAASNCAKSAYSAHGAYALQPEALVNRNGRSTPPKRRPLRVAIAEDDDEQREVLEKALELEGFEVVSFEDGAELVDYFSMAKGRVRWPDAIVTDLGMPGRSGLEAVQLARKRGIEAPVFIVTGNADPQIRAQAAHLGNTLVFLKPINVERLAQAIWQLAHVAADDEEGTGESPPSHE